MLEDLQKLNNDENPIVVWTFYFGPQGISVDPCTVDPFSKTIRIAASSSTQLGGETISLPPPFPKGRWRLEELYDTECWLTADGEVPPTMECGEDANLITDFEKDPGYKDAVQTCDNGLKYQRGYFTEYTAKDVHI